jgi:hypothetical protein
LNDRSEFPTIWGVFLAEAVLEVPEQQHARDLPGVVAEQEAANGGYGAEDYRLGAAVGSIYANRPSLWDEHSKQKRSRSQQQFRQEVFLLFAEHDVTSSATNAMLNHPDTNRGDSE